MTVTVKSSGALEKFLTQFLNLKKSRVDVGFFPEAKYKDGTSVAQVAMWNEFGTETKNGKQFIPPRPFLLPTYNENKEKWKQKFFSEIKKQLDNKKINVKKALGAVGFVAQHDVQDKIDWWAEQGVPRNAKYTQEKKGFDSPLIENGHLRQSVAFEVTE